MKLIDRMTVLSSEDFRPRREDERRKVELVAMGERENKPSQFLETQAKPIKSRGSN